MPTSAGCLADPGVKSRALLRAERRRVPGFLFLPGDNDIGGEDQPLTLSKMKRFQETFNQPELIQLDGVDLFKVNRLAYAVPHPEEHGVRLLNNRTRVVLTHLPLLFLPSGFVQQANTRVVRQTKWPLKRLKLLSNVAEV
ncbi:unnamed protein product [Timema podura]|uniref:Uncharacterized protein n=1 Tax=Timema podura TaxID=61482 RepID=A0ABN7PF45_TIMPD|nr:unnamed protein product [Timema podura]